jgi:hypothetical protein
MLCRVSCEACNLSSLWTDDPRAFLETVCSRYRRCQAKLAYEEFSAHAGPRTTRVRPIARALGARAKIAQPLHHGQRAVVRER